MIKNFHENTNTVNKTMPCAPSPSHHNKYIGGINFPFPVMAGKVMALCYPSKPHLVDDAVPGYPHMDGEKPWKNHLEMDDSGVPGYPPF